MYNLQARFVPSLGKLLPAEPVPWPAVPHGHPAAQPSQPPRSPHGVCGSRRVRQRLQPQPGTSQPQISGARDPEPSVRRRTTICSLLAVNLPPKEGSRLCYTGRVQVTQTNTRPGTSCGTDRYGGICILVACFNSHFGFA